VEDNQRDLNSVLHFVSASNGNQNGHQKKRKKEKKNQEEALCLTIACSEALEVFNSFSQLSQRR